MDGLVLVLLCVSAAMRFIYGYERFLLSLFLLLLFKHYIIMQLIWTKAVAGKYRLWKTWLPRDQVKPTCTQPASGTNNFSAIIHFGLSSGTGVHPFDVQSTYLQHGHQVFQGNLIVFLWLVYKGKLHRKNYDGNAGQPMERANKENVRWRLERAKCFGKEEGYHF